MNESHGFNVGVRSLNNLIYRRIWKTLLRKHLSPPFYKQSSDHQYARSLTLSWPLILASDDFRRFRLPSQSLTRFLFITFYSRSAERYWGKQNMPETSAISLLSEELRLVQSVINRMGTNSFLIKGWAITLIVATLLLRGNSFQSYIAFFP